MKPKITSQVSRKSAHKKPEKRFPDRLISAIRRHSAGPIFTDGVLIIDFKSLKLIGYSEMRQWAQSYVKTLPRSIQAVICDPIPPDVIRVGIRAT